MAKVVLAQILLWTGLHLILLTCALPQPLGYRTTGNVIDINDGNVTINIIKPPCIDEKPNPCDPNPCKYGGICHASDDLKDYNCVCQFPMGGGRCGELSCPKESTCYRLNDTVYFAYRYAICRRPREAEEYCVQQGQTIAQPKEKSTLEFIRLNLLARYEEYPESDLGVWIGLKRQSESAPWKWLDGAQLTYNDRWASAILSNNKHCVGLPNGPQFQFLLNNEDCDGYFMKHQYYPLCQQTFPFLNDPYAGKHLTTYNKNDDTRDCPFAMGGGRCGGPSVRKQHKPCFNSQGEQGLCMFVLDCIRIEGQHLGTCVDGFQYGSCCGGKRPNKMLAEANTTITLPSTTDDAKHFETKSPPLTSP